MCLGKFNPEYRRREQIRDRYCEGKKMLDEKHCSSWGCLCIYSREKLEVQGGKRFHNA